MQGFDLTFDGAYIAGTSTYIVHAIGLPLLPKGTGLTLDDDGPCKCVPPSETLLALGVHACAQCRHIRGAHTPTNMRTHTHALCRRYNSEDDLPGFELITSCKRLLDAAGITEEALAGKTLVRRRRALRAPDDLRMLLTRAALN